MNKDIKLKIAITAVDVLLTKGLPAMATLISSLNSQSKITLEDIEALHGELDSESWFDPNVTPLPEDRK